MNLPPAQAMRSAPSSIQRLKFSGGNCVGAASTITGTPWLWEISANVLKSIARGSGIST